MMEFTPSQKKAIDGIMKFLLSDEDEAILNGQGGMGKSLLTSWFQVNGLHEFNKMCNVFGVPNRYYHVYICATTNKAAEVLTNNGTLAPTVHSLFKMKVKNNYNTGSTSLDLRNTRICTNSIIFVDECSMVNAELRQAILECTYKCKIIYVGDECQLLPVKSSFNIFKCGLPTFTLTEQVRFTNQGGITSLAQQLRETVISKEFKPLHADGSSVISIEPKEMEQQIIDTFKDPNNNARIVTYTNSQSIKYTDYIKHDVRHLTDYFNIGERFISANAVVYGKQSLLHVEDEVQVIDIGDLQSYSKYGVICDFRNLTLKKISTGNIVQVPAIIDHEAVDKIIKQAAKLKQWYTYFMLKEQVADLRPRDACTVHKVQGSTLDKVFVDLRNIGTCRNPDTVARLLYVACTRARKQVVLCGKLPAKYGGAVIKD